MLGAELHAAEALDLDRCATAGLGNALEVLLDGEVAISDVVLLDEADLRAELVGHALLDADESLLRRKLALLLLERVELDLELSVDLGLGNVLGVDVLRRVRGDLEADHVGRLRKLGRSRTLLARSLELDENADLAAHVDVARNDSGATKCIALAAADLDVLARLGEKHLVVVRKSSLDVLALKSDLCRVVDELDERLGLGDEVRLAVDLGQGEGLLVCGLCEGDDALLGLLVDALGGDRKALLAKELDGFLHVAVRGGESFLASAHSGGGCLAELLDHLNGNCHCCKSCCFVF